SARGGLFVTGNFALRRATKADTASVLASKLLERFRAETWSTISLSSTLVSAADSTYKSDQAYSSTLAVTDSSGSCSGSSVAVACNPSRAIPDTSQTPTEVAPDGKSYRLDTYVNWGCSSGATPDTSGPNPTCASGGLVKSVTIVVRDNTSATTLAAGALYRITSSFDRLSGGSMPTVTVSGAATTSTTTTTTTTSSSAPSAPTAVALANGGGSGSAYVNASNVTSMSFDVTLPSTSLVTDTITLIISDGNTANDIKATASGTSGSGIVHFTGINGQVFVDGPITVTATAKNSSGTSSATTVTVTKDTVAPDAPTSVALANGQGTGNAYVNSSNASAVSVSVGLDGNSQSSDTVSVTLSKSGSSTSPVTAAGTSGSGTVTATGINASSLGDGTLTASATVSDVAGNASTATTSTMTKDATAPTASITLAGSSPTSAGSLSWTVTFSESVTSVSAGAFSLANGGLGGTPGITSVSGSGTSYTVTASTGTGSGTLGLNLSSGSSVKDAAGNAPPAATGAAYTIDRTPPTATITRAGSTPTNANSLQWTVTFSESVTGVAAGNFTAVAGGGLGGSPSVTGVSGSGTTYTVTTSGGSGSGTLGLNLTSAGSIQDAVGNAATVPATGALYTIDRTAPTATITLAGSSPTTAATAQWTVTFSESVTGVAVGNFSAVTGGLSGSPAVTGVTGSGTTYTVTASTGYGNGTLHVDLTSAGSILDAAGNTASAPATGASYTVNRPAPTVTTVLLSNGGSTAGKIEKGDTIKIVFSSTMSVASFCSTWSGDGSNQSLTGNGDVTVTVTDGTGATN